MKFQIGNASMTPPFCIGIASRSVLDFQLLIHLTEYLGVIAQQEKDYSGVLIRNADLHCFWEKGLLEEKLILSLLLLYVFIFLHQWHVFSFRSNHKYSRPSENGEKFTSEQQYLSMPCFLHLLSFVYLKNCVLNGVFEELCFELSKMRNQLL
ncbi:PREDICTED: uncharacterized protein LOC109176560 [Ipomoea nil]|uniref:uncharacterized protein LOC109176560 n=1 Tax=Ipomoea nil TaxID=35883 RepID=UPI000901D714|nr:PREDICTED: uncharacterized protein LOC109176560 [Ipomoea nil]